MLSVFFGPSSQVLASDLTHSLHLDLTWSDWPNAPRLTDEKRDRSLPGYFSPRQGVLASTRSLGLTKAKWKVQADLPRSQLAIVLRPDAVVRPKADLQDVTREVDLRSGSPYRPKPEVTFLDSYLITYFMRQQLQVSLGVFERLGRQVNTVPSPLEFGLRVQLPKKFSAVGIHGHFSSLDPPKAHPKDRRGYVDILAIQGRYDRVERVGGTSRTFDQAPVTSDPYWGGAISGGYQLTNWFEAGGLLGFGDRRSESLTQGYISEWYLQLYGIVEFIWFSKQWSLSLDSRVNEESWIDAEPSRATLQQISFSQQLAMTYTKATKTYLCWEWGKSQRHVDTDLGSNFPIQGWQLETGVRNQLDESLSLGFAVTSEQQKKRDANGHWVGAFDNGTRVRRNISRLALQISFIN